MLPERRTESRLVPGPDDCGWLASQLHHDGTFRFRPDKANRRPLLPMPCPLNGRAEKFADGGLNDAAQYLHAGIVR